MMESNQITTSPRNPKSRSKIAKYLQSYSYLIEYSSEAQTYVAQCAELGITAYQARPSQALAKLKEAITIHLRMLEDNGEEMPIPFNLRKFSGQIKLKMSPQKHQEIAICAQAQGISLNHYINSRL